MSVEQAQPIDDETTRDASIEGIDMESSVRAGTEQTVSVTESHYYTTSGIPQHLPPDGQRCDNFFQDVRVRLGARVSIDGEIHSEQVKCVPGAEGTLFLSESSNTFNLSYVVPDRDSATVTFELFWGNSGEVIQTVTRQIDVQAMSSGQYETTLNVPDTAQVGEEFPIDVEVCCRFDDCPTGDVTVLVGGTPMIRREVDFAQAQCDDQTFSFGHFPSEPGELLVEVQTPTGIVSDTVLVEGEGGTQPGGDCGVLDWFTDKDCCPAQFRMNLPGGIGTIDPPNVCLIGAGLAATGVVLLWVGGDIVAAPVDTLGQAAGAVLEGAQERPILYGAGTIGVLFLMMEFF